MPTTDIRTHREARKKQTAECFTPPFLTNEMLDKLTEYAPKHFWKDEDKTFLDPACGNGNLLVEVLKRKLHYKHDPLKALQSLYGTDIMADNVKECRQRLLKSGGGSEETTLRQWVEDIIFREKLDKEESKMGVELEEIIA